MQEIAALDGKICLISGAGSGIGRAVAIAVANAGAHPILVGRNRERLEATREAAGIGTVVPADVRNKDQIFRVVDRAVDDYGRLDCAFNNAGSIGEPAPLHETSEEDFRATIETNLFGLVYAMQAQLPVMLAQGRGSIVNVASAGGLVGSAGNSAYCASKHAVVGLSKSAALEGAGSGVRVNVICPGIVDTQMTRPLLKDPASAHAIQSAIPIGRVASPEEVAGAVVWLLSDRASFVTGSVLPIDGGYVSV